MLFEVSSKRDPNPIKKSIKLQPSPNTTKLFMSTCTGPEPEYSIWIQSKTLNKSDKKKFNRIVIESDQHKIISVDTLPTRTSKFLLKKIRNPTKHFHSTATQTDHNKIISLHTEPDSNQKFRFVVNRMSEAKSTTKILLNSKSIEKKFPRHNTRVVQEMHISTWIRNARTWTLN